MKQPTHPPMNLWFSVLITWADSSAWAGSYYSCQDANNAVKRYKERHLTGTYKSIAVIRTKQDMGPHFA